MLNLAVPMTTHHCAIHVGLESVQLKCESRVVQLKHANKNQLVLFFGVLVALMYVLSSSLCSSVIF